jgi:hypothetical protein
MVTNRWELPVDPYGFYPFTSEYSPRVYSTYFGRHDKILVFTGMLRYGRGTIILNSTFPVHDSDAFDDSLFYNLILMPLKKKN